MHTDSEQLPGELFAWMEEQPFASLSDDQQSLVLQHFSLEEYDELHRTIHHVKNNSGKIRGRESIKQQLTQQFDEQHASGRIVQFGWQTTVLRIAAGIVLLVAGWSGYAWLHPVKEPPARLLAAADTVYVTKEMAAAPQLIHDTVYYTRTVEGKKTECSVKGNVLNPDEGPYNPGDLPGIVSIKDADNALNAVKSTNLKSDSLPHKFTFVTL